MKQNNETAKQKVYNLTQITGKPRQIEQHLILISLLNSQIDLLKKTIGHLNNSLQFYHQSMNNLAQLLDLSPKGDQVKCQEMQKIKVWLFTIEQSILKKIKEEPKEVERIVVVEKTVEVQIPVFIERTIEVSKPITVIKEVEKYVEKPIYIQKIVEVPIFVEKKQKALCKRCECFI